MSPNDNPTITRSIITDYFHWRLKTKVILNNTRLFFIVRKIANDCERTYLSQQPTINFQCSSLIDLKTMHYEISNELFNDGIITWTRIISLISFSALLTKHLIQQQQQNTDCIISSMIDWTTNFINTNLRTWLESQNYWDGCLKMYDKIPQRRNSISRYAGILGTIGMLTFGALYMKRM